MSRQTRHEYLAELYAREVARRRRTKRRPNQKPKPPTPDPRPLTPDPRPLTPDLPPRPLRLLFVLLALTCNSYVLSLPAACAQWSDCPPGGGCPTGPEAWGVPAMPRAAVPAAVCRIRNCQPGGAVSMGSATLIHRYELVGQEHGLVLTCWHTFREALGRVEVAFPNGRTFAAVHLEHSEAWDLAVFVIASPAGVTPVTLGEADPPSGAWLTSSGYGSRGEYLANGGRLVEYVTSRRTGQAGGFLEISGSARSGDSGGPVLDSSGRLVGVVQATNGQVVTACSCKPIRRFLGRVWYRIKHGRNAPPPGQPPGQAPAPQPEAAPAAPGADVPPSGVPVIELPTEGAGGQGPGAGDEETKKLRDELDRQRAENQRIAAELEKARQDALRPPDIEIPTSPQPLAPGPSEVLGGIAKTGLTAFLVAHGVPMGLAGLAAGAAVWLVGRRARKRLGPLVSRTFIAESPPGGTAIVDRQSNYVVEVPDTTEANAWAEAVRRWMNHFPGSHTTLAGVEHLKNQILKGNPQEPAEPGVR